MTYTVRPIDEWPGPQTRGRRRSPFRASWGSTASLLRRELDALQARNTVLMIAVEESDIRLDGLLRANARPRHPGVVVAFDSRYGPLKYATDTFSDWQDNVRAIALGLEALRKVDRYGITKRGEQYTGWKQLESGNGVVMSAEKAREILAGYGGWRDALKATHPDHGGDPERFQRVQQARAVLAAHEELTA